MAYDHEEQEQLATMKAWWRKYGNLITWSLIVILGGYAAWTGWNAYQRNQSTQAAQLYESVQQALESGDNTKVQRAVADMQDRFGKTLYASMSGLAAAKSAVVVGDNKTAKAQLQWVIDHAKDEGYQSIAKVRLAGLLLDEKSYDQGLKLLAGVKPAEFAALVADRKGDILVAQDKLVEARSAYQEALDQTDEKDPARPLIQIKLDALGGSGKKAA